MKAFLVMAITVAIGIGIVGAQHVQAYTVDSLSEGVRAAGHLTTIMRIATLAIETCTSQITAGDTSNVDTCIRMMKTFDTHMTAAITEATPDIKTITGYGPN